MLVVPGPYTDERTPFQGAPEVEGIADGSVGGSAGGGGREVEEPVENLGSFRGWEVWSSGAGFPCSYGRGEAGACYGRRRRRGEQCVGVGGSERREREKERGAEPEPEPEPEPLGGRGGAVSRGGTSAPLFIPTPPSWYPLESCRRWVSFLLSLSFVRIPFICYLVGAHQMFWDRPGRRAKGGLQRAAACGLRTGNGLYILRARHDLSRSHASNE